MTDPVLASLLMEHPFADDEGLLFTIDRSVTAGEARAAARALADELQRPGRRAGIGGRGRAAERPRGRHHDDRGLAGGRRVRAREPALPGRRGRTGARRDRSARPSSAPTASTRRDAERAVRPRRGVRDVDVGHHRRPEGDPAHPRGVPRAPRPRARAAPRASGGRARPGSQAVAQPHPGVARAERRHLQRAVRAARRRAARDHGQLPAAGVRRARAHASRSARPCCRPGPWRCCPTTTPSPTSRRSATCGASPRRCHRSRRAGSRASSARRC